jgi:glucosamine 6-phosphate synthetase-like amidotransferase/phosphosugar isomerase protein
MCGLIHVKKYNLEHKAYKSVIKRFEKQKTRGTDGFGFIEIKDGKVIGVQRAKYEKGIMEKLEKSTADEILFHHRIPTSTPNFIEATHPILVSHDKHLKYDYYVIHNGIISNDDDLKEDHEKIGFKYTTEIIQKWITTGNTYESSMYNDSESMAIDFCLSLENKTSMKAKGSIALIVLQVEKKSRKAIALYFGRNSGNPLCVEDANEFFAISSESGKEIDTHILYKYDYKTKKLTSEKYGIGTYETRVSGYNFGYGGSSSQYDDDEEWLAHKGYNGYEEDDFEMDIEDEMEYLEDELKTARANSDYDTELEVLTRIEELKIELDGIKKTKQTGIYY